MQMRRRRQVGLGFGVDEVLLGTPFDPTFTDRVHFQSNLLTWLRECVCADVHVCVRAQTWYLFPRVAEHKSPIACTSLPPSLPTSLWKGSQFVGDTSLVGVRISVGGHRSVGGGSDKL